MEDDKTRKMGEFADDLADELIPTQTEEEELERRPRKKKKSIAGPLILSILIIAVIIGVALFLLRRGDGKVEQEMLAVQGRLAKIEVGLRKLERTNKPDARADNQGENLQRAIQGLKNNRQTFDKRLNQLENRIDTLQAELNKRVAEVNALAQARVQAEAAAQPSYHTVERGETLYRIAIKYGLTVDRLRELNDLQPAQIIYPGQRLLVSLE
jgi:LysM repeat protein